jgi:hypothetical protein
MRTGRYFVPMVPAMAVLAGLACAALARTRLGWAGAAAPVAVAWALQAPGVVELRALARGAPERARHYAALVAALERRGIEAAFGHLSFYPLNFLSGERIAVTSLRGERYLPIAGRVEEATRVGVLDNHGGVRELLACSGGTGAAAAVEGHGLDFGFVPPPAGRQEIPPERWAAAADASGADLRAALSDRDLGTAWTAPPGTDAWVAVELRFRAPEAVRLLRWVPPPGAPPPAGLRVEEWPAGASGWARPREFPALSSFHWSDGRPYAGGRRFRLEYSAGDRRVEALRLRVPRGRRGAAPALAELQVFAPAPDPPAEEPSVAALLEWASSNGIRRVHADRGLSVRLHAAAPGAMQVELEPGFQAGDPAVAGGRFAPEPGVALVVPAGEADISREVLSAAGMAFAEVRIGPWDVFHRFAAPRAGAARTTYWTGVQVLFGSSSP